MLVAFNFDGTLTESDTYELLAEEAGVAGEVVAVENQSRTGDLEVAESLRERAARLEGLPELEAKAAFDRVSLRPGAAELMADLRAAGHHVAIVTHAPLRAVDLALDEPGQGIDSVVAPTLEIESNALTGELQGQLLDESKGDALVELAATEGIGTDETMAIGSGDADREMLDVAADAICFAPEDGVDRHCETTVTTIDRLRDELDGRELL